MSDQLADRFDCISPLESRYWDKDVAWYLSERAFLRYKCRVERALIAIMVRRELCPLVVLGEIDQAIGELTPLEVDEEEGRIRHDIRALVNCLRRKMQPDTRPYVHLGATSYDIVESANALRYREVTQHLLIPNLKRVVKILIELALREADTVQIGRTHGQHAVPLTFGYALANYIVRLGRSILMLDHLTIFLGGKFSGAVGAYNATALLVPDPEAFEQEILQELSCLHPVEHATQIVPPEPLMRLMYEVTLAGGIMADLADSLRHLARTEINEIGEAVGEDQVGSSTMPQKKNPINLEFIKSLWKKLVEKSIGLLLNQLSEHQRDLTGSASSRSYPEIIATAISMAKRLNRTLKKLVVDRERMLANLALTGDQILAEPLYILLAKAGHPDAHEAVRRVSRRGQLDQQSLLATALADSDLYPYLETLSDEERAVLTDPERYTGLAAARTRTICGQWQQIFP